MDKPHLSVAKASTIVFSIVENDILKTFDKKYKEVKKSGGKQLLLPKRQLKQLEIIYGPAYEKAISILREKQIKPCTGCPKCPREDENTYKQFKISGTEVDRIYHLAENSCICECRAFQDYFFIKQNPTCFQCKHLLAVALWKYFKE